MADIEDGTDVQVVLEQFDREQIWKTRFAPKDAGQFLIRILPPRKRGAYYVEFGTHFDINALSPKFLSRRAAGCVQLAYGQECPFCAVAAQLFFESKIPGGPAKELEDLAKGVSKKQRYVMNVILVNQLDKGVLTWEVGRDANDLIRPLFRDYGDITHPEKGRNLTVTFTKKEGGKWNVATAVVPKPEISPITYANWREERHDLEAYVAASMMNVEAVKKALLEIDPKRYQRALQGIGEQTVEHPTNGNAPLGVVGADPHNLPGEEAPTRNGPIKPDVPEPEPTPQAAQPAAADTEPVDPMAVARAAGVNVDDSEVQKLLKTLLQAGKSRA